MSNHSGSYLLNEVLRLLEKRGVFEMLGVEETQDLVLEIVRRSRNYDCNSGEILDEIGKRLGICIACLKAKPDLIGTLCSECYLASLVWPLQRHGTERFGEPDARMLAILKAIDTPLRVEALAKRLPDAASWEDLLRE